MINYYLDKRADKFGDAPIRASICIQGARFVTSIGYNISPKKWDSKRQRVRQGCSNSKGVTFNVINARTSEITAFFEHFESEAKHTNTATTKEDIKNAWAERFKVKSANAKQVDTHTTDNGDEGINALFACFEKFVAVQSVTNQWTIRTKQKLNATRAHMYNFCNEPTFDTFDKKGLGAFIVYLQDVQQLRDTTVKKYLSCLKWFLRWAVLNDYPMSRDFEKYKPKFKTIDRKVIFLTWQELMTMYTYEIPESKEYLRRVRDVFCFCCFTSLRYSDVENLKRSDIVGNSLHITTVKTADSLKIELNKYSKAILNKYKSVRYEGGKALPVVSNQKMNDYLKELGELCGLDEPQTVVYYRGSQRIEEVYPKYELLGTHAGRRTFICNALALGIPANVVMKWTGHSDYKAMKPYIDVADNIKAEQMSKFDNL